MLLLKLLPGSKCVFGKHEQQQLLRILFRIRNISPPLGFWGTHPTTHDGTHTHTGGTGNLGGPLVTTDIFGGSVGKRSSADWFDRDLDKPRPFDRVRTTALLSSYRFILVYFQLSTFCISRHCHLRFQHYKWSIACNSIDHSILAYNEKVRCFEEMACIFVLLILKII